MMVETREGETAEEHSTEEHIEPVFAVLLPWFVQAVGVVAFYVLTRNKYLHGLPYTVVMFTIGMLLGVAAVRCGSHDELTSALALWRGGSSFCFDVISPAASFLTDVFCFNDDSYSY